MSLKIRARRLGDTINADMILLSDTGGMGFALVRREVFWETGRPDYSNGEIFDALSDGREVTLELSIAEEKRR